MTARAELPSNHPILGSSSTGETQTHQERFNIRYHTLVKSYTFLTKRDGWYQIGIPYFEEASNEEIIPYDHLKLSEKLVMAQDRGTNVEEESKNHSHIQEMLVAQCDFIHPKLIPLQGHSIVPASAYKEVAFSDQKKFGQADVVYIIPDTSLVVIEVGRKNGRGKQVAKHVNGLKDMAGQELTVYKFFCHYDFDSEFYTLNNMNVPLKKLTFRPIYFDE